MGMEKNPDLVAFSCGNCKLAKIEAPKEKLEGMEVLDISVNALGDLSFLENFPNLQSLTMFDLKDGEKPMITKFDQLKPLAKLTNLRVMEFSDDLHVGMEKDGKKFESEEDLRKEIFTLVGENLFGVNGFDRDGAEIEDFEEEEFEELDSDDLAALEELPSGDEDEDDEDEDEDEEGSESVGESDEPPAKKAKTE